MQERNETLLFVTNKLQAFQLKLTLRCNKIDEGVLLMFPFTAAAVAGTEEARVLKKTICNHLDIF